MAQTQHISQLPLAQHSPHCIRMAMRAPQCRTGGSGVGLRAQGGLRYQGMVLAGGEREALVCPGWDSEVVLWTQLCFQLCCFSLSRTGLSHGVSLVPSTICACLFALNKLWGQSLFFFFFSFHLCAALYQQKSPEAQRRFCGNVCKYKNIPCKRQAGHRNAIWQPAQTCHCILSDLLGSQRYLRRVFSQSLKLTGNFQVSRCLLTGSQASAQLGHSLQSSDSAQRLSGEMLLLLQGFLWQLFVLSTQQLTTSIGTRWVSFFSFYFFFFQDNDWQLQQQIFKFLT